MKVESLFVEGDFEVEHATNVIAEQATITVEKHLVKRLRYDVSGWCTYG